MPLDGILREITMPSVYPTVFASTGRRKISFQPLQANRLAWWRADYGIFTGGAREVRNRAFFSVADNAAFNFTTERILISIWVKRASIGAQVIVGKNDGIDTAWFLQFTATDKISFWAVIGGVTKIELISTTSVTTLNVWNHILVSVDRTVAGNCKIYLNGVSETLTTATTFAGTITNTGSLYIGQGGYFNDYFDGSMAALAICKPTTEVSALAAASLYNYKQAKYYGDWTPYDITTFNPTVHYNCNEPAESDPLYDQVGTNDGVMGFDNMVANGTFATTLASWTDGPVFPFEAGKLTWAAGSAHLECSGDNDPTYVSFNQALPFIIGRVYRIRYAVTWTDGDWTARVDASEVNAPCGYTKSASASFIEDTTFTTTTGAAVIDFFLNNSVASGIGDILLDNVIINATSIPSVNGPNAAIISDSISTSHGVLTGFSTAQEITCFSSDVPTALGTGYSLSLDGSTNRVIAPHNINQRLLPVTICAWIKTTGSDDEILVKMTAASGNGYGLIIMGNKIGAGYYSIGIGGGNLGWCASTTDVNDGTWHHVGAVITSTGVTFYLDGVADGTVASVGTILVTTSAAVVNIGGGSLAYGNFTGKLDDIRLYSGALTAPQMLSIATGTDFTTGLISKWKCDDGIQTISPVADDPVICWESKGTDRSLLLQTTASNRPLYKVNVHGLKPAIYFDGVDNFLTSLTALFSTALGTVFAVVMPTDTGERCFLSQYVDADSADSNIRFDLHDYHLEYAQNDDGTEDNIWGDKLAVINEPIALIITSSGAASGIKLYTDNLINVLTVNTGGNNGDWFSDVTGTDKTQLGAFDGTLPFKGYIFEIAVYSDEKALNDVLQLAAYARSYYSYTYIT